MHLPVEDVEALQLIDRILRRVDRVVHDEGLAFRFEVLLGHDVNDVAILGEDLAEGVDQDGDLDVFIEVFYLCRVRQLSVEDKLE